MDEVGGGGQKFFVMGNYFGSLNTDGGTGPSWMNPMGEKINKSIAKQAPKKSPKLEMALHEAAGWQVVSWSCRWRT